MKRFYNQREVSRLLAISESQIRYWDKVGLVHHVEKERGQLLFDFQNLVAFRTVKELMNQGISLRRIRTCIEKLRKRMPGIDQPLSEMRLFVYEGQIILCKDNLKLTPDGQLLIDFKGGTAGLIPLPVDAIEELFFQALRLEQEGERERAKENYERILTLKPDHADALVNMGNLMHESGSCHGAEDYYRKALRSNPDHVEANYNLANLFEERDDLKNAILFYHKAIHENPDFPDAHFNLARLLERTGDTEEAKEHWRWYLDLDPSSEWAEYARKRLR